MSKHDEPDAGVQPKILFLVLSQKNQPWAGIEELGQRSTFAKDDFPDINFLWVQGKNSMLSAVKLLPLTATFAVWWNLFVYRMDIRGIRGTDRLPGMRLISRIITRVARDVQRRQPPVIESRHLFLNLQGFRSLIGLKTLLAFEYLVKHYEFDYIIRTNSSSYFDLSRLRRFIASAPRQNLYAGYPGQFYGEDFLSGAAFIMSRDVVTTVVENPDLWNLELPDDVAISRLVAESGKVSAEYLNRKVIESKAHAEEFIEHHPAEIIDDRPFHYRCKTGEVHETVAIMRTLHAAGF